METTEIGNVGDKFIDYIKTKKIDINNKKKLGKVKIKLNNLGNNFQFSRRTIYSMLEHLEFSNTDIDKIDRAWVEFVFHSPEKMEKII